MEQYSQKAMLILAGNMVFEVLIIDGAIPFLRPNPICFPWITTLEMKYLTLLFCDTHGKQKK